MTGTRRAPPLDSWRPSLVAVLVTVALASAAPAAEAPSRLTLGGDGLSATVAHIRIRNLEAMLSWTRSFVPLPLDARNALAQVLGKELAAAVKPGAPIDALALLDPEAGDRLVPPLFVVGASFRSAEEALKAAQAAGAQSTATQGGYHLQVRLPATAPEAAFCLLAPARGPAHLVCGVGRNDVERLAPLMVGPLAAAPGGGADLHVELRIGRAFDRYRGPLRGVLTSAMALAAPQLTVDGGRVDRALADLMHALAEEIMASLGDLDHGAVELTLGERGIELWGTAHHRGKGSVLGRLLGPPLPGTQATPPAFWQLPADAASASWSALQLASLKPLLDGIIELGDAWLAHVKLPARDRQRIVAMVRRSVQQPDDVTVVASGPAPRPAARGRHERSAAGDASAASWIKSMLEDEWNLVGQRPARGYAPADVKEVVALWNLPSIQKPLKRALAAIHWPTPVVKMVPAPASLGAGAADVLFSLAVPADVPEDSDDDEPPPAARRPPPRRVPVTFHMITLADGDGGWLAIGRDPRFLAERLAIARGGSAGPTLANRDGLDDLRPPGLASGGFYSLVDLAGLIEQELHSERGRGPVSLLPSLPHHGETPMVHVSTAIAEGTEWSMRVPRAAIEDAVFMLFRLVEADTEKGRVKIRQPEKETGSIKL